MRYYGSLSELRAVVSLPSDLQFIEDWPAAQRGGNSSSKSFASLSLAQADYVPVNSLNHFPETIPGYGLFTPESVWGYWQAWARARIWPPPEACVSRSDFAKAFRTVFDEVRPRIDLQNPPSRSYLALHVREGDKRRVPAHIAASVRSAAQALGQRTGLPWVVISDNETAAIELEAALKLGASRSSRGRGSPVSLENRCHSPRHNITLRFVPWCAIFCALRIGWRAHSDEPVWWLDRLFVQFHGHRRWGHTTAAADDHRERRQHGSAPRADEPEWLASPQLLLHGSDGGLRPRGRRVPASTVLRKRVCTKCRSSTPVLVPVHSSYHAAYQPDCTSPHLRSAKTSALRARDLRPVTPSTFQAPLVFCIKRRRHDLCVGGTGA